MADISGYLQNIRNGARGEDVRDSIINALDKINKDNPITLVPGYFTANATYPPPEGGMGYSSVTVQVPEGASQALSLTDIKITENGDYEPDDGAAYRNIKVEVPLYVNEIMTDEKVVYLEEGDKVYYALDDGYDGYSAVHVMSGGSGGGGGATYYVDFLNTDGSLLERVTNVPFGGGAVYHKPLPTSPGMRFVGWNPNPLNVKSNMECIARFENMTYDPNQILDDWVTIAQKCQTDPNAYNIGQWKLLEFNDLLVADMDDLTKSIIINNQGNPVNYTNVKARAVLVGKGVDQNEGENGYINTTWMCIDIIGGWDANFQMLTYTSGDQFNWANSAFRQFLQGQFTTHIFPQVLTPYIKRVTKKTNVRQVNGQNTFFNTFPTTDWFFIPSLREFFGGCTNVPENVDYIAGVSNYMEAEGAIYDYFSSIEDSGTINHDYEATHFKRGFTVYGYDPSDVRNYVSYLLRTSIPIVYGNSHSMAVTKSQNACGYLAGGSGGNEAKVIGFCI